MTYITVLMLIIMLFFFNTTATTEIYTLSLHDALPIYFKTITTPGRRQGASSRFTTGLLSLRQRVAWLIQPIRQSDGWAVSTDRKSTRLNSSHITISYAVFCLKKKK